LAANLEIGLGDTFDAAGMTQKSRKRQAAGFFGLSPFSPTQKYSLSTKTARTLIIGAFSFTEPNGKKILDY
jgi:hypothetical protein